MLLILNSMNAPVLDDDDVEAAELMDAEGVDCSNILVETIEEA